MKKFFNFILFLVLFFVSANSFAQATTDGNDYARSNRYDKYAVDICYNANGIYGNETDAAFSLNGFSLGISCEYVYFDGLWQWQKHVHGFTNGAFHIGENFAILDDFKHNVVITPLCGVYIQHVTTFHFDTLTTTEDKAFYLDYGIGFKYSGKNRKVGFLVKLYNHSGMYAGVAYNFGD